VVRGERVMAAGGRKELSFRKSHNLGYLFKMNSSRNFYEMKLIHPKTK
jgi:hypothetical protein